MPVYGTSHGGLQQFDKISYSNIDSKVDGNRLYATNFVAWIYLGTSIRKTSGGTPRATSNNVYANRD